MQVLAIVIKTRQLHKQFFQQFFVVNSILIVRKLYDFVCCLISFV